MMEVEEDLVMQEEESKDQEEESKDQEGGNKVEQQHPQAHQDMDREGMHLNKERMDTPLGDKKSYWRRYCWNCSQSYLLQQQLVVE